MFKNLFTMIGGGIAVAGAGLAVAGLVFGSGPDRFGLVVPGIFMIVFGLIFYRVGSRIGKLVMGGRKVLETGRPGRGTITKMWETGVTINEQPVFGFEMDLEVEGAAAGAVSVQQVVPRMLAGAVLPGHSVAVKVDQDDPTEVVIDWSEMPAPSGASSAGPGTHSSSDIAAALGDAIRRGGSDAPEPPESAAKLLRTGRRGTARVTSVADVGEIGELGLAGGDRELEDDRLYVIGLDVKLPGRSPYPAQIGHRVPDRLIGRVGPGLEVQVAVDRDNDQSVAVDWDASIPPLTGDHAE